MLFLNLPPVPPPKKEGGTKRTVSLVLSGRHGPGTGIGEGYIAFHSIPNIWYILRKTPEERRREMLADVCRMLRVVAISHEEVVKVIQWKDFKDLEDCLQAGCAAHVRADYIVTRNTEDFINSEIPAILPEDFLKKLKSLS